jgi:hypothetical protein
MIKTSKIMSLRIKSKKKSTKRKLSKKKSTKRKTKEDYLNKIIKVNENEYVIEKKMGSGSYGGHWAEGREPDGLFNTSTGPFIDPAGSEVSKLGFPKEHHSNAPAEARYACVAG